MPARDPLAAYRQKRDFAKTSEPKGDGLKAGGNRFVIHKHHATADHYDLRLEYDGVLKSWAVPKGPSLNPADKRYAVETEDHPLDYIDFEAVIPAGEYGGGPMIVWDTGEWAPMGDVAAGLAKGDFKFRLYGQKLSGGWVLVRMKPKPGDKKSNWLLIKEKDDKVDTQIDILTARPESVKSGLTIEELLAQAKAPPPAPAAKPKKLTPGKVKGAVRAPMPQKLKPMLATPVAHPPREPTGWLHEIKLDGYRTLAFFQDGAVRLMTRTGIDWTERYGVLAEAFAPLACREAILDGEIVVVDAHGVTHFEDLQQALHDKASERLTFFAFDLVHLDGYDLRKAPLLARKELLRALVAPLSGPQSAIHFSDHVGGDGTSLYEQASELGLEGVVSKRETSAYVTERSKSWVKAKAVAVGDFPIVGYTKSPANGGLGALAMGRWVDGELDYAGNVGTGFDNATMRMLLGRLAPLAAGGRASGHWLAGMPKDVIPVRPVLTAHIHYANITADGAIRHGVFRALREPELSANEVPAERARLITDADLAAISITNAGRKLFGKTGPTKLDLAIYYAQVGDFMLPHILGRPVSLVRSPTGKADDLFFQRHPFNGMPPSMETFETLSSEDGERRKYIAVGDAKAYLALAQFGVIEFHAWNCHVATLETPDQVIFDLDPGEGVKFRQIVEAAFFVRDHLTRLGLTPFVKTSGGKGLHVVVPLKPKLSWKQVHVGTGVIATAIAKAAPETFVVNMAKDKRSKRIFIDFHRNGRLATAVAPYSLRARANLPASTPVNWGDLRSIDAPEDLNYSTLPAILNSSGDPWAAMDQAAGDLAAALKLSK